MDVLLGVLFCTWLFGRVWASARTEHELARQGIVPPRMAAKYGPEAAARKVSRYGFLDHLRDAWNDYWPRRTDALIAARDARASDPGQRVSWRDRWAAARESLTGAAATVKRAVVDPRGESESADTPTTPQPQAPPATDTGDIDPGTRRLTDDGWTEWDGTAWRPVPEQPNPPQTPPAAEPVPPTTAAPQGDTQMTAPTGETVNYETTVNDLEQRAVVERQHVDSCTAVLASIAAAKAHVNDMQETYRAAAQAATTSHEHLAAQNLDSTTLAHSGQTVDAMPAGAVDAMYDHLEEVEQVAQARLADAEVALASTEAELDHVVATYSAAHETVAGHLSGDASFLDAGGVQAQGPGPALNVPQPGSAGGPAPSPRPVASGSVR